MAVAAHTFPTVQAYGAGRVAKAAVDASIAGTAVDFAADFVDTDNAAIDISASELTLLTVQNVHDTADIEIRLGTGTPRFTLGPHGVRELPRYHTGLTITVFAGAALTGACYIEATYARVI